MASEIRKRNRSENQEITTNKRVNTQNSPMAGVSEIPQTEQSETKTIQHDNEQCTTLCEIMESLKMLHSKFDEQKQTVANLYDDLHASGGLEDRVTILEDNTYTNSDDTQFLKQENAKLKNDISVLKDIVTKQSQEMKSIKSKLEDLTTRSMRENILFHNIPEDHSTQPEDVEKKVRDALRSVKFMDNIQFDRIHRLGPQKTSMSYNRPIVAKTSGKQVASLLEFAKTLPKDPKRLRITRQLPQEARERRSQLWEMGEQIKAKAKGKVSLRMTQNNLYVNGERHIDPLVPPTIKDILSATDEERVEMQNEAPELYVGKQIIELGSSFVAAVSHVDNIKQVKLAHKNYLMTPGRMAERHNIVCYRVKDQHTSKTTDGWFDDDEHGAGRRIRDYLQRRNLTNLVVFLSRGSDGAHLGPNRYKFMEDAIAEALKDFLKDH